MEEENINFGKKLILGGFVYLRSYCKNGSCYWDCNRLRQGECTARAITTDTHPGDPVIVTRGPTQSPHQHPPNREEAEAEKVIQR